jgi:hypothetical protein
MRFILIFILISSCVFSQIGNDIKEIRYQIFRSKTTFGYKSIKRKLHSIEKVTNSDKFLRRSSRIRKLQIAKSKQQFTRKKFI